MVKAWGFKIRNCWGNRKDYVKQLLFCKVSVLKLLSSDNLSLQVIAEVLIDKFELSSGGAELFDFGNVMVEKSDNRLVLKRLG